MVNAISSGLSLRYSRKIAYHSATVTSTGILLQRVSLHPGTPQFPNGSSGKLPLAYHFISNRNFQIFCPNGKNPHFTKNRLESTVKKEAFCLFLKQPNDFHMLQRKRKRTSSRCVHQGCSDEGLKFYSVIAYSKISSADRR